MGPCQRGCSVALMRAGLIAVVALLAFTPPLAIAANGPSSGVHVDPGSPAGKQYSLPIASARSETSGHRSSAGAAGAVPFGAGVTPAAPSAPLPAHPQSRSHSHSPSHRAAAGRGRSTAPRPAAHRAPVPGATPRNRRSGSSDLSPRASRVGGSSWMALAAGGALVLLLGGGGGLALRRWGEIGG